MQDFLAVNDIKEKGTKEFYGNGVLGLAPSEDYKSFVRSLYEQEIISREIVALNLEDPTDTSLQSAVTFGEIDGNAIVGGEESLSELSNFGMNKWAVLLNDLSFTSKQVLPQSSSSSKLAFIDSANNSIQVPATHFETIKLYLQDLDESIHT